MSELNRQRVEQMKAGDDAAFEWLLDCFEQPVYRFLFCSLRDEGLAVELSGEVFGEFVLALRANKLRDSDRLAGFIFGIARNVLRRAYQRRTDPIADLSKTLHQVPSHKPSVPERLILQEELKLALQRISRFRDLDRQVMLLRFVEGLKLRDIADALNISLSQVKVTIHRCRKKLQESAA